MTRPSLNRSLFTCCLILLETIMCSWGFLAHRTEHRLAVYMLPGQLCTFFYKNIDYLEYNAVRPDVRRKKDKTEAPKHFIDLEVFGDGAAYHMPQHWGDAVKKYTRDTLQEYGYLPYWIIEMQRRLTHAFKQGNADSILFYAADLGHYIEDAHVPLHTSINYDGQLTNQKGLHALWETVIPELAINNYILSSKHKARYIKHKELAVWSAMQKSQKLLPDIFEKEKQVSLRFPDSTKYRVQMRNGKPVKYYTPAFAKAYSEALNNTINEQIIASANMVADFWYTAWKDAGKPNLDQLQSGLTAKKKATLKKELHAFRHNRLIAEGYLNTKNKEEE